MTECVKLCSNASERLHFDSLADMYSILVTTECLERAYVKDAIAANEYVNTSM